MANRTSTIAHFVLLLLSYHAILVSCLNIGRVPSLSQRSLFTSSPSAHVFGRAKEESKRRRACVPPFVVGSSSIGARNVQQWQQDRNYTEGVLSKRMILPAEDSTGAREVFVVRETVDAEPIVWQSEENDDLNTALFRPFPKTGEFSLSTSHLCGCSSLWIISRKGVYATHWWESISFSPDASWRNRPDETDEQVFQRTVVDHIRNGHVSAQGNTMHEKLVAGPLEDLYIKAYLVRPSKPWSESLVKQYRRFWDQITATVKDIIPTLQDDDKWQEITYDPVEEPGPLDITSRGRILFKFDAHHGSRRGPAKAALWVESAGDFHKDEWR